MCFALRECWYYGCHNPAFQPTKCNAGKQTPCSGWLIRIGGPSQNLFCDEHHKQFNPPTLASDRPEDSKYPNPLPGAYYMYQAQYHDAGNTRHAQSYNGSDLSDWKSLHPSTVTDALVPSGPYPSIVTHDGTILTHSIPGGLHATGPIPDPLPPWYIEEETTLNNPPASGNTNDVALTAPGLASPHHTSQSQSSHHGAVDKQVRHGSQSSRAHGYR